MPLLRNLIIAAVVICTADIAYAQVPTVGQPQTTGAAGEASRGAVKFAMEPSLIVMNAYGASLQYQTLTLTGVSTNSIVLAARPVRAAGHLLTAHVLEEWAADGCIAKDPPNAQVSVLSSDGDPNQDVVVELKTPVSKGMRISIETTLTIPTITAESVS